MGYELSPCKDGRFNMETLWSGRILTPKCQIATMSYWLGLISDRLYPLMISFVMGLFLTFTIYSKFCITLQSNNIRLSLALHQIQLEHRDGSDIAHNHIASATSLQQIKKKSLCVPASPDILETSELFHIEQISCS